ncbi:hypothetical protein EAG_06685, partial [Camponotus floridanus]
KLLMKHPLPCRADKLMAMNRLRFRVAIELLTGH